MQQRPLLISSGEPAGIGPDLCLQLLDRTPPRPVVIAGDRSLLTQRSRQLGLTVTLPDYDPAFDVPWSLLPIATATTVDAGQLDARNARYVLQLLDAGIDGCMQDRFAALVTAPVHKGIINDAGITFTGHTEYLAQRTATPRVVMMLAGGGMRVALATTHLPLAAVSTALTAEVLQETLTILHHALQQQFGLPQPRILVAGLNPHAGEGGHMGREEIEVIEPVLHTLRAQGMQLQGPLPADTLFQPKYLANADAVLAMYHDQGLPVLKYASFGEGINITLGLPMIRTSVDHGTALDLAGTGHARAESLWAALLEADQLARHRYSPAD